MSRLNDDQDVINEGRKNPLKDVDASLRDQIPKKLLAKAEELELGNAIVQSWYLGNASRAYWLERQQNYLQDWDEFLVSSSQGAFEGSSSLHLPVPLIVAKTLHARFLQALLGIEPPFMLKARTEASVKATAMVQEVMEYAIREWANHYEGAAETLDDWVWQWITSGCGLLKLRWDCQYTRFVDVVKRQKELAPRSMVDPETGLEQLIPQSTMEEVEVPVTKKKFEGPVFECVFNEDLLIIGGEGNPQKADQVQHRHWMTASELWTMADRKIFDADAVEAVIRGGKNSKSGTDTGAIKFQRAFNAGISQIDNESQLDRYEMIEAHIRKDIDGSGINADLVVWVHLKSRRLMHANYLHRMNKSGERPFFKIDFHKRQGQDYGIGIIEMIHPLTVEMDAMHNMRIDFGLLSTMPFGFYRPTSSIEPETLNLEPGALIPVDNPQTDVYFPNLGNRTSFGMQEEAALQQMVERVTNISDFNLGLLSGQGAARTATGARALLGESNANLDVHLRRLNIGWKKALDFLCHMLQQRLPEGFSFRLTGEDGDNYFSHVANRDDIQGDFDFEVSANSASSNSAVQQENAQQLVQITSNPLDIQLQIVDPLCRYEALRFYVSSLGIKDYGKYIKRPKDAVRIFTPEEEVNRILRGVECPVTPQSDHEGFINYFEYLKKNPEVMAQYSREDVQKLAIQEKQHQQMLAAMNEIAAQQRNAQQMRMNASMSAQQAPLQTPGGPPPMQQGQ